MGPPVSQSDSDPRDGIPVIHESGAVVPVTILVRRGVTVKFAGSMRKPECLAPPGEFEPKAVKMARLTGNMGTGKNGAWEGKPFLKVSFPTHPFS
jgi:hypothetical protein